jgi:hypothetical protein
MRKRKVQPAIGAVNEFGTVFHYPSCVLRPHAVGTPRTHDVAHVLTCGFLEKLLMLIGLWRVLFSDRDQRDASSVAADNDGLASGQVRVWQMPVYHRPI